MKRLSLLLLLLLVAAPVVRAQPTAVTVQFYWHPFELQPGVSNYYLHLCRDASLKDCDKYQVGKSVDEDVSLYMALEAGEYWVYVRPYLACGGSEPELSTVEFDRSKLVYLKLIPPAKNLGTARFKVKITWVGSQ